MLGGQASSQGVTRWDERGPYLTDSQPHGAAPYGSSKSYEGLKLAIRHWYRDRGILKAGVNPDSFNPGWHPPGHDFSADPAVVHEVLQELMKAAGVAVFHGKTPASASKSGRVVVSVSFDDGSLVSAKVFIDATDLGDLWPLCGVPYNIGAEAHSDTGEPGAPPNAKRSAIQPFTVPIAVERKPGQSSVIPPPAIDPNLIAAQNFRWEDGDIGGVFTPRPPPSKYNETIFDYRQYIDHRNFDDPRYATDRSTLNVGSNDYQSAVIPSGNRSADHQNIENARKVSLSYLRWLETEVVRDDDVGKGYPELFPRPDAFAGTTDATAPSPYIRESRRLAHPLKRILEQDISWRDRPQSRAPTNFTDSGGIGWYFADIHASPFCDAVEVPNVMPFQVPIGALIPQELDNVLAGCKNLGTTHITGSAYRVHPAEWSVGEAAGALAAFAVERGARPGDVWHDSKMLGALQTRIVRDGAPIFWWDEVTFADGELFAAAQRLGVLGFLSSATSLSFRPKDPLLSDERATIEKRLGRTLKWPANLSSRADLGKWLLTQLTDDDVRKAAGFRMTAGQLMRRAVSSFTRLFRPARPK